MDKNKEELDRALATNHNLRLAQELKTIQPGQALTEAQKQAFQALMRMAHDPRGFRWNKRVEKMNARQEREAAQNRTREQPVVEEPEPEQIVEVKRPRLRAQIKEMRRKRMFPLRPQLPDDRARRYGFIPASQRQRNVEDYAKV